MSKRQPAKTVCPTCHKRAVGVDTEWSIYCEHCGGTMFVKRTP